MWQIIEKVTESLSVNCT